MHESQLLGRLLVSLPELQQIAKNIREKYNIPEVNPGEDGITKLILADQEINWDDVQKDIDAQVRSNPNLLPPEIAPYLALNEQRNLPDEPDIYEPISDKFRATVTALYKFYVTTIKSLLPLYMPAIDQYCGTLASIVKAYLLTGKGTAVPDDWFGAVHASSAVGERVVIAMASQLTNQKAILAEFKSQMKSTFGENTSRITPEDLSAAEDLALLASGKTLRTL